MFTILSSAKSAANLNYVIIYDTFMILIANFLNRILMIERPNYHARYSSELSSTDFIDNSVDTTVMKPKVNGLNGISGNKWNRGGKSLENLSFFQEIST